ncbi:TOBE domain-containing protein [Marinomonas ostreistagni]|uniref:TOBE domain-containing protein n=1 Tax=Marinomonas ostreistagni TaxID=359209 RepID=UPI001EF224DD|nr:TOBE domain-containing protein [Marinomonas ostreistagni]
MKTSARNQFLGTITAITDGAVNTEVTLDIGANQSLVAIITQESAQTLGLVVDGTCTALIKASSVILSADTTVVTSARNKLIGKIAKLVPGAVNTDVTLDIGNGKMVSAIITNTSVAELGLKEGADACALFKAPSVLLMAE